MYCKGCGCELLEGTQFCKNCGTPVYESNDVLSKAKEGDKVNSKSLVKSLVFSLIALIVGVGIGVLVATLVGGNKNDASATAKSGDKVKHANSDTYEGDGFDTPEEAIEAYIEAFSNGDIKGMYKCWSIESTVDNYTIYDSLNQFKAYVPTMSNKLPIYGDISRNLALSNRQKEISNTMTYQYMMLMRWDDDLKTMSIILDDDSPEGFVEKHLPNNEKNIKNGIVIDKIYDLKDLEIYDRVKQADEKNKEYYHVEEMTSVPVVLHVGNDYYFWAAGLAKYNGKWYLDTHCTTLSMVMGYAVDQGNMEYIGNYSDKQQVLDMIK